MKRLVKTTLKTIAPALAVVALLSTAAYAGPATSPRQHDTLGTSKRECRTVLFFWRNCELRHSFSTGYGHGSHSKSSGDSFASHESHSGRSHGKGSGTGNGQHRQHRQHWRQHRRPR